MAGSEAAALFVKVSADISDASRKLDTISTKVEKSGGIMRNALGTAIGMGASTLALGGIGAAFNAISGGAIGMNAELEKSTLQFTTLMKSSDKAQAKVQELFDFAAKTPFESGPIIKASRIMQTFGGDALNTKKNLTLFGDAAAATSAPIDEVSFWMSRAYAAIQGGQPFGEARMRLMELGIITPQVAGKMEELQKKGASSSQLWGMMTGELGKFNGAMTKQAGTWEGLTSTMSDNINMTIAKAGKPLFELLKQLLGAFNNLVSSPAFQGALESATTAIAAAFTWFGTAVGQAWAIVQPILGVIGSLLGSITGATTGASVGFNTLGATLSYFAQTALAQIGALVEQVVPKFAQMAGKAADWIIAALPGLLANLATYMTSMLGFLIDHLPDIAAKLMEWGAAFVSWIGPRIPQILAALGGFLARIGGWLIGTAAPKLLAMAANVGMSLVQGFLKFIIGPPGLFEKIATFVTGTLIPGILTFGPKLLSAAGDIAGKFVDGFIKFLGRLPGMVANVIRDAFRGLRIDVGPFHISGSGVTIDLPKIDLPHFASGAESVPFTGPAVVHKGEMILPADLAARIRGGGGVSGSHAATVGGGDVHIHIGSFYGTEGNIRDLAEALGDVVRYSTLRRAS